MADTTVVQADCLDAMSEMPECSVDAVVTDPPAAIAFMGKAWDGNRGGRTQWVAWMTRVMSECRRVLKPGGHAVVWALPRTSHWTAWAVEDAGLEIRDVIVHLFGSGYPKSLNVSKAIDRMHGAEREVLAVAGSDGAIRQPRAMAPGGAEREARQTVTAPATEDAARWDGWGTALKPAAETWILARKPLESTVAANVLAYGTGALNINATRIASIGPEPNARPNKGIGLGYHGADGNRGEWDGAAGRWPANVVLDEAAAEQLDTQTGDLRPGEQPARQNVPPGTGRTMGDGWHGDGNGIRTVLDSGGASRFFYTAKASSHDRGPGNDHPTVKPVELMRWLIRLVTPPDGLILDPFAGSGSTGVAAAIENRRCILIERESEYVDIIRRRLAQPIQPVLGGIADAG